MKSAFEQRLSEITEIRQCAVLLKKFLCNNVMSDCETDDLRRAIVRRLFHENCKEIFFHPIYATKRLSLYVNLRHLPPSSVTFTPFILILATFCVQLRKAATTYF